MVGTEFGLDASAFGLMNSIMAIGSVAGALLSAGRGKPRLRMIFGAAAAFGVTSGLAALAPNYFWFGVALVPVGLFAITMMTSANGYVQTTTDPVMRGRVMALYMAIFMGGTPIGAPLVGWVANVAGARWSLGVAAASGIIAALISMVAPGSSGSPSTGGPAACASFVLSPGWGTTQTAPPGKKTRTTPSDADAAGGSALSAGDYLRSSPTT
jgi:MFS family permease